MICHLTGQRCDDGNCFHGCIKMVPEQDRPKPLNPVAEVQLKNFANRPLR